MARRKGSGLKKLLKNKLLWLVGAAGLGFWLWKRSKEAALPVGMPQPIILPGYEPTPMPTTAGLSNYVTTPDVSGMGFDVDSGASAFGFDVDSGASAFGRAGSADAAYDDTF